MPRDWRYLRARLLNLKTKDAEAVTVWLRDAGYLCQTVPAEYSSEGRRLSPERDIVSPDIRGWLGYCKDAIGWMMTLDKERFVDAVRVARKYHGRVIFEAEQRKFKDEIDAPVHLEMRTLHEFLTGFSNAPSLHASFFWDAEGEAAVAVDVSTPMEALAVSVHVDRNFTARRWASCRQCGSRFEQKKSTDLYCSRKCKNNFITARRRQKINLLRQADRAWGALPYVKKKGLNRLVWTVEWVQRRFPDVTIDQSFAKQILSTFSKRKG